MSEPCASKVEITEALQQAKSAHHRLDEHKERMERLEDNNKILHEMNTNIKLMVQQNGYRDIKVDGLEVDVKAIQNKPKDDFEKVKWIIIGVVVTAITTAVIMSLPTIIANLAK